MLPVLAALDCELAGLPDWVLAADEQRCGAAHVAAATASSPWRIFGR